MSEGIVNPRVRNRARELAARPRVRQKRARERGNAMVLATIVLTALATLSGLTVVSVQGGIATSSNDRFHTIAVYAAESGGAVAMDYLRKNINKASGWTAFVTPSNSSPQQPAARNNSCCVPGTCSRWTCRVNAWILNNRSDTGTWPAPTKTIA
jgi:Tfp pilus assembly protein PilX